MKFTKKLFAAALALCLMLCLSIPVFAEDAGDAAASKTEYLDSVPIAKIYKLNGEGTSPQEEFVLEQTGKRLIDGDASYKLPDLEIEYVADNTKSATAEGNAVGSFVVTFPKYERVGVYEYTLEEKPGKTAGVTYNAQKVKLTVTVVNGKDGDSNLHVAGAAVRPDGTTNGAKKREIENTYSAGTLEVKKVVAGNLGDKSNSNKFKFTVTFTKPDGKDIKSTITARVAGADDVSLGPDEWDANGKLTYNFELAHEGTAVFFNLPEGVHYEVVESDATRNADNKLMNGAYEVSMDGNESGNITAAGAKTTFTNTKNGEIDMGVTLDNLPYILVLVAVLGGAVVMFTRKRRFED